MSTEKTAHTPGLMAVCDDGLTILHEGSPVAVVDRTDNKQQDGATAKRFAACWNACEGIENPEAVGDLVAIAKKAKERHDQIMRDFGNVVPSDPYLYDLRDAVWQLSFMAEAVLLKAGIK